MRKLIIGSLAVSISLIAWMIYMHYDTNRFIQSVSRSALSTGVQPLDSVVKESTVIQGNRISRSDSEEQVSLSSSAELSETEYNKSSETGSNVVPTGNPMEIPQETTDTKLSPELEILFTEYRNLYEQSLEVSRVFSPLMTQHITATHRMRKIFLEELVAATDETTKQALYDELNEIKAWKEEVKPQTIALQEERQRISEERSNLLEAAGFSSREEFMNVHRDTYINWISEQ